MGIKPADLDSMERGCMDRGERHLECDPGWSSRYHLTRKIDDCMSALWDYILVRTEGSLRNETANLSTSLSKVTETKSKNSAVLLPSWTKLPN